MIKNKAAKSENFLASNTKTFQKEKGQKAKLSRMCQVCTVLLQKQYSPYPTVQMETYNMCTQSCSTNKKKTSPN